MADSDDENASPQAIPKNAMAATPMGPPIWKPQGGSSDTRRTKLLTSTYLDQKHTGAQDFYFQNLSQAASSMAAAQWFAPINDASIPQTDADDRQVIQQLVQAFLDMSVAKDTKDSAYRKRFTLGSNVCYKVWTIEACAWDVLRSVKSIHINGFKASIYDQTLLDSMIQTRSWTFQTRIEWICCALKISKNVAVNLMKNEKHWTIIGAPQKLYNSTLTNTVSNAHRNNWVKHGRDADQGHQNRAQRRFRTDAEVALDTHKRIKTIKGIAPAPPVLPIKTGYFNVQAAPTNSGPGSISTFSCFPDTGTANHALDSLPAHSDVTEDPMNDSMSTHAHTIASVYTCRPRPRPRPRRTQVPAQEPHTAAASMPSHIYVPAATSNLQTALEFDVDMADNLPAQQHQSALAMPNHKPMLEHSHYVRVKREFAGYHVPQLIPIDQFNVTGGASLTDTKPASDPAPTPALISEVALASFRVAADMLTTSTPRNINDLVCDVATMDAAQALTALWAAT